MVVLLAVGNANTDDLMIRGKSRFTLSRYTKECVNTHNSQITQKVASRGILILKRILQSK